MIILIETQYLINEEVWIVKKFITNIIIILTFLIIYFLHSNLFTWFRIAGVMPNLFVILVLFIGLYSSKYMGVAYGIIFGLLLDLFIGSKIGVSAIMLGVVGAIGAIFDKNFSKENRITLIVMSVVATFVFELGKILLMYIINRNFVDFLPFIEVLLVECLYNAILTIILYPLMRHLGNKVENEYKGNKILTRYF